MTWDKVLLGVVEIPENKERVLVEENHPIVRLIKANVECGMLPAIVIESMEKHRYNTYYEMSREFVENRMEKPNMACAPAKTMT